MKNGEIASGGGWNHRDLVADVVAVSARARKVFSTMYFLCTEPYFMLNRLRSLDVDIEETQAAVADLTVVILLC